MKLQISMCHYLCKLVPMVSLRTEALGMPLSCRNKASSFIAALLIGARIRSLHPAQEVIELAEGSPELTAEGPRCELL